MYLKTLVLRGFKSFANPTVFNFNKGIIGIVGPNGSGKSNVADALTWVLGEQSTKTLRGSKMEDVIFAGSVNKPALGRAEVEFNLAEVQTEAGESSSVTITRRVFKNGASEYEIDGIACRLIDVQELLYDFGIGREMHTIIGQGKLTDVLESKPEARRVFIEEAAGILKYRNRKTKTIRKLDNLQQDIIRLTDLTNELKRQLKPLSKQANTAREAELLTKQLREATLRIAADELNTTRNETNNAIQLSNKLQQKYTEIEISLNSKKDKLARAEFAFSEIQKALGLIEKQIGNLNTWHERLKSVHQLAIQRQTSLINSVVYNNTNLIHQLNIDIAKITKEIELVAENINIKSDELNIINKTISKLETSEQQLKSEHLIAIQTKADKQATQVELAGEIKIAETKIAELLENQSNLQVEKDIIVNNLSTIVEKIKETEINLHPITKLKTELLEQQKDFQLQREKLESRIKKLAELEKENHINQVSLLTKIETLSASITSNKHTSFIQNSTVKKLNLSKIISVQSGWETAIATILGDLLDSLIIDSFTEAIDIVNQLENNSTESLVLLIKSSVKYNNILNFNKEFLSECKAVAALEVVNIPGTIFNSLSKVLANYILILDSKTTSLILEKYPNALLVNKTGDIFSTEYIQVGIGKENNILEINKTINESEKELKETVSRRTELTKEINHSNLELEKIKNQLSKLVTTIDDQIILEKNLETNLIKLKNEHVNLTNQLENYHDKLFEIKERLDTNKIKLKQYETRRDSLIKSSLSDLDNDTSNQKIDYYKTELAGIAEELKNKRNLFTEIKLNLHEFTTQKAVLAEKYDAFQKQLKMELEKQKSYEDLLQSKNKSLAKLEIIIEYSVKGIDYIRNQQQKISLIKNYLNNFNQNLTEVITTHKLNIVDVETSLAQSLQSLQKQQIITAQSQALLNQLEQQAINRYDIGVADLITNYASKTVINKPEQLAIIDEIKKKLASIGKINPFAFEEFESVSQRYDFLLTQLNDIKDTRKKLLAVVAEVDAQINTIFYESYTAIATEFTKVFSTIFPGGEGKLKLTQPDDLLTTGIEIFARPSGKKINRLSLLSGGEKCLTALAFIVAIFKVRPSPFYVLDEVEAALDDINLQRLLGLLKELKQTSQLIIITHQKNTMELADVLYGVTMSNDGVSKVISQKISNMGLTS